ncbi:MAG: glycosyltransferase family 2 protein, partial [Candidatus Acidiferrales bacterium]
LVAVIVLNWNNWPATAGCLESLQRLTYPNARVLLVDNGSTDDSERILREKFPDVELVQTGANLGYAGGNNAGMRRALELGADYLCLLNNDVVVDPGFLEPLVAAMEADPRLGVAGGLQCGYDDRRLIQNSGAYFNFVTGHPRNANAGEADRGQCNREKEVDFISGAALLARVEMARSIGLLDDAFFMVGEDADWCLRARRAGWSVRYIPGSKIFHKERATRGSQPAMNWYYVPRNHVWLVRRHGTTGQLVLFTLLSLFYFGPRQVLARAVKKELRYLKPWLRGLRDGYGALPPVPFADARAWREAGSIELRRSSP